MSFLGIDTKTPFAKESKQLLRADLERLKTGELGLTDAEKEQQVADAQSAAAQQAGQQQAALNRQAAAGGGFTGQQQATVRKISEQAAEQGARARRSVDELNTRLAEQQRAEILDRLETQRQLSRENTKYWIEVGVPIAAELITGGSGISNIISKITGGEGGGLALGDIAAEALPAATGVPVP